jgi:hypothetical protein
MGFFRWLFGARRNLAEPHAELGVFAEALRAKGWTETTLWEYAKGDWQVGFDTSSWMIVSTKSNPRVFDVNVPGHLESGWTVNLIEHLCRMEDERHRLREVLKTIRDNPGSGEEARSTALGALQQCYHGWLVNVDVPEGEMGRVYCAVCGQKRHA